MSRIKKTYFIYLCGWLALLALGALVAGGYKNNSVNSSDDLARRITILADRYVAAYTAYAPEAAEILGFPLERHDGINDNSLSALKAWRETEDKLWKEIETLGGHILVDRPEWITWGVLRDELEASRGLRVCRSELWRVNPVLGWQAVYALLADLQPVGSVEARVQALNRFRALPRFIDNEIANLRLGASTGYTAARRTVQVVIEQFDELLAAPLEDSPFMSPANRDPTPEFQTAWRGLVENEIHPALRRYRDYLRDEYLGMARASISICANPSGADGYRALLRSYIGMDLKLESLWEEARKEVDINFRRKRALASRLYGDEPTGDPTNESVLHWLRAQLERDPRNQFRNTEDIKSFSERAISRGRQALPLWFRTIPETDVVPVPFPNFQQPTAPSGNYVPAPPDGSRPATYQFRIWDPIHLSRAGIEVVVFHETYPGHHLQMATAAERGRGHPITRLVPATAYAEGWAVYSEALAEDMGIYSSDIDLLGRLSESLESAAVVDIGMQVMGWSRERAVQFLADHRVSASIDRIEAEVDNYLSNPGYIVTYPVAGREMLRLRTEAQRALGVAFDIREFHERILEDGPVPLWMLRDKIARWIISQKAKQPS